MFCILIYLLNIILLFQPRTSLEMEVAALLRSSENVVSNKRELTPAEEKALQAMSIEEVRRRFWAIML